MKPKISGIPFEETVKVESKNTKALPTMKALVYGGPGKMELKDVPIPTIAKPTDHSSITEVPGIAVQRYPVSIDVNSISHHAPWQCIYTVLKDTKA